MCRGYRIDWVLMQTLGITYLGAEVVFACRPGRSVLHLSHRCCLHGNIAAKARKITPETPDAKPKALTPKPSPPKPNLVYKLYNFQATQRRSPHHPRLNTKGYELENPNPNPKPQTAHEPCHQRPKLGVSEKRGTLT